ncbi:transposase ORFA [Yersinia pseudotuberculosis]|nr:transposase ORFA [Yersinia pseudotuberculosis]
MKKARFTETQILRVLKEVEGGRHVKDVCRENGGSEASYYNWKSKYGGMESSDRGQFGYRKLLYVKAVF